MDARFSAFELEAGATYEVVQPFEDYDGLVHPAGERWAYVDRNFFPYDAGLTLYVRWPDGEDGMVRLQDYDEAQGKVIAGFSEFVRRVE